MTDETTELEELTDKIRTLLTKDIEQVINLGSTLYLKVPSYSVEVYLTATDFQILEEEQLTLSVQGSFLILYKEIDYLLNLRKAMLASRYITRLMDRRHTDNLKSRGEN